MFGSLMMLVFGCLIIWLSLVRLFDCFCLLFRKFGKVVRMWLVREILCVLMVKFVVLVKEWMIGRNEVDVSFGVLLILV